jgi:hypothetical protein
MQGLGASIQWKSSGVDEPVTEIGRSSPSIAERFFEAQLGGLGVVVVLLTNRQG